MPEDKGKTKGPLRPPFDHEPTREEMIEFLASVPSLEGLDLVQYVDFCLPMKRSSKVGNKPNGDPIYEDKWQPYFMTDGKLLMFAQYHRKNGGMIQVDTKLVEHTENDFQIFATVTSTLLGTCCGRATGRLNATSGAEKSHPVETCETSAIQRALACFGFGLMPGAGLASAEDMKTADARQAAPAAKVEPEPVPHPRVKVGDEEFAPSECPNCGGALVEKNGIKNGKEWRFWGCEKWRETGCDYKQWIEPGALLPDEPKPKVAVGEETPEGQPPAGPEVFPDETAPQGPAPLAVWNEYCKLRNKFLKEKGAGETPALLNRGSPTAVIQAAIMGLTEALAEGGAA